MLERMDAFFNDRSKEYDCHQLTNVDTDGVLYPYTASCLPKFAGAEVLDLGCGTGLELEEYFELNPTAQIVGVDLAEDMLNELREKFPDKDLTLLLGSYFDLDFGTNIFDAVVSVESLHHFKQQQKIGLYEKVKKCLKENGYFVLTDYFALSDEEENAYFAEFEVLKKQQGITDGEFYHFDTPLTVEHEVEALKQAGFSNVEVLKTWGCTTCIKAYK